MLLGERSELLLGGGDLMTGVGVEGVGGDRGVCSVGGVRRAHRKREPQEHHDHLGRHGHFLCRGDLSHSEQHTMPTMSKKKGGEEEKRNRGGAEEERGADAQVRTVKMYRNMRKGQ